MNYHNNYGAVYIHSMFQYQKNRDRMNMVLLRNTQGLHAPMRIAMELKAAEKIGRLPFLPSSCMMKDVLLGRDEEIGYINLYLF